LMSSIQASDLKDKMYIILKFAKLLNHIYFIFAFKFFTLIYNY
jgi:hypothetical protein